jgi:two-component system sensor kinase FixL
MSWVTFIWASVIGACATMALSHLLIGIKRRAWENLLFAVAALSVGGIACGELAIMHSGTTEEIGRAQQWAHLPIFFLVVAIVGFVRLYFGTGRLWLGTAACVARLVSLIINFAQPPNLNFRAVTGLRQFNFLGETIAMPEGVVSAWTRLGELSSLLMLAFVVDASVTLWRRGTSEDRRRAVVVGGSITLFIVLAAGWSALIHTKVIHMPYLISFPFLGVIAAMGFELSYDILRAAQTAQQLRISEAALRESEERVSLAAEAGNLGLWVRDIQRDQVWMTEKGRALFGFAKSEALDFNRFLKAVHIEDRQRIEQAVSHALAGGGDYESEYRIVRPDGKVRWIAGFGRVEFNHDGKPICMRGVARDITLRKEAEDALKESEARFRTVANAAPVMIWMSGTDKLCNFFNKGWLDFTGRTMEQELGNGWAEGVHTDDLEHCLEVYGNSFNAWQPFTMEYRLRRNDGEYRWVLDSGTPRFADDGAFIGYIGSCIDITMLRQAELEHQLQHMDLARV